MWRGKIAQQIRARKLRSRGRSLKEISQLLHVSKSSVSGWVRNVPLGPKQRLRLAERERRGVLHSSRIRAAYWREYRKLHPRSQPNLAILENRQRIGSFFDTWNDKSAYVLGYFAADGCMYHSRNGGFYDGGYYFQFDSTDQELILLVKKLIGIFNKAELKVPWQNAFGSKRKLQYKLRLVSKKAFQRLLKLGFTPHKSLTLTFPPVPKKYLSHFVRGYFDGDGCVYFARLKRGDNGSFRHVFMVRFTCGSRGFLEVLQRRLSETAGIGRGSLHPHTSVWDLSYSTRDAVR